MGDRQPVTRAQVARAHEEWRTQTGPRTGVAFGVRAKDGTPLGHFGINWLSYQHRVAELGAVIGERDYWGGGYGTDALLLLVDYAFDVLDMRKVWLTTISSNLRVVRQMEKVGFALEARQRHATVADGVLYDALVFGRLRDGWPGYAAMVERLGLRPR
jgi:RimJ/RimL family protein N-acetyltransferase